MNHTIRRLLEAGDLLSALRLDPDPFVQQTHKTDYGMVIWNLFEWSLDTDHGSEAAAMFEQVAEQQCNTRSFALLMLLRAYTLRANSAEAVLPLDHQQLRTRCLPVINDFDRSDLRWIVVGDAVVNDLENRFPWSPAARPTEDPSLWWIRRPSPD